MREPVHDADRPRGDGSTEENEHVALRAKGDRSRDVEEQHVDEEREPRVVLGVTEDRDVAVRRERSRQVHHRDEGRHQHVQSMSRDDRIAVRHECDEQRRGDRPIECAADECLRQLERDEAGGIEREDDRRDLERAQPEEQPPRGRSLVAQGVTIASAMVLSARWQAEQIIRRACSLVV